MPTEDQSTKIEVNKMLVHVMRSSVFYLSRGQYKMTLAKNFFCHIVWKMNFILTSGVELRVKCFF